MARYNADWESPMIQSKFKTLVRKKSFEDNRNLTLRVIAEETGLSVTTVQRFNSDTVDRFDGKTLDKLCKYFCVSSLSDLIEFMPAE